MKKSKLLKKWAKKHGYKLKDLKLRKHDPRDLHGIPMGPLTVDLAGFMGQPGKGKSVVFDEPTTIEMTAKLCEWGFTVGKRDHRVNRKYRGDFMVVEAHEDNELPTDDGSNGPWAIVGDDLAALVREAYAAWCGDYAEART